MEPISNSPVRRSASKRRLWAFPGICVLFVWAMMELESLPLIEFFVPCGEVASSSRSVAESRLVRFGTTEVIRPCVRWVQNRNFRSDKYHTDVNRDDNAIDQSKFVLD